MEPKCDDDREVMFKRIRGRALKEKRQDDTDELVARYRWDIYKQETEPLIDHYPQEMIRIIDADTIPAEVLSQILTIRGSFQFKRHVFPHQIYKISFRIFISTFIKYKRHVFIYCDDDDIDESQDEPRHALEKVHRDPRFLYLKTVDRA